MGLREQIKQTESEEQIVALLKAAQKYKFASERTKRSWKSTAKYRIAQLTSSDIAQEASAEAISSKKSSKKKNK